MTYVVERLCYCVLFTGIELIEILDEGEHAAVRVGAGATNLQMLEWSQKSGWTMPMNIIALMISYGGANATITHGAGINNKNLNDIVIKVLLSRAEI